ncbi:SulP family sulfate permease [Orenia metallireducens]|jgi:SulP family sulfate permease|uniref:Sulfate permease, SulP family n=1 Tax=Orenia metallireducens TaxID=1413210 RepID=A0A285IHT3_9FIRM|nr:SulP family inorganic anion transporter [Orenia metallireducens]PRX17467.1 SulP family sulfate permease [Orenia metallireducens]SNY47535.1 sulfate permease, SulP family [Orenia metallireducens]
MKLSRFGNKYKFNNLKYDISAGLSVAAIALPQNMAYALIVGVDPIYGLYTSIVSMIVATFVGNSNYMVVGPTNLISVALASALTNVSSANYFNTLLLLTCMIGLLQILLGILQLSNLVKYVPHSVIVGLTTGIALLIGVGQIGNILGIEIDSGFNLFSNIYNIINGLEGVNYYSLGLGIISGIIIIFSQRISAKIPAYLLAILTPMLVVYTFDLSAEVAVVDNFSASLPKFSLFEFNLEQIDQLFASALSISILGFIQVLSITKSLEDRSSEEVELNKEFIGQGIINLCCSFFSSFAISGSFTNSFSNYQAGAKTRLSELFTALIIILSILLLSPVINYVPVASLATLVLLVAYSMIDIKDIKQVLSITRFDMIVFLVTFLTTISTPRLDYAVYFGVLVSLTLVLRHTDKINFTYMNYRTDSRYPFLQHNSKDLNDKQEILINLAGNLHFNSAKNLKNQLNESFIEGRTFILRMRDVDVIDITSIKELDNFIEKVYRNNGEVLLSGISPKLYAPLNNFGIVEKIGEENIFFANKYYFSSTKEAMEKIANGDRN